MKKPYVLYLLFKEKNPAPWTIALLFILAHLVLAVMMLFTFPIINKQIGTQAFDLQTFGYSSDLAFQILSKLDASTIQWYLFPQLFLLDIIYPFLLATALSALLRRLYQLIKGKSTQFLSLISLLPFVAMVCDYTENLHIAYMITHIDSVREGVIASASLFTILKSLFTTISWVLILVLGLQWIISKLWRTGTKTKPAK